MKLGVSRSNNGHIDDENPYWISFSDIMAGLLVIFILASLVLILELLETKNQVDQSITNIEEAEKVRRKILREIQEELKERNILVEVTDNESVLRIPKDLLAFETDQSRIPPSKEIRETVYEIGRVVYERIVYEERWQYLDTVFIEGHTDSRRSYRQGGNWRLSVDRAISVWKYWLDNLPVEMRLEDLDNHNEEKLFSVSGYAETRPAVKDQATEADYIRNRRIDIRFTVKKPTQEDFKRAISPVDDI